MTHRTSLTLALAFAVAAAIAPAAAQDRIPANERPADCPVGGPLQVWLLLQSSATDCDDTVSGTVDALCCCVNNTWAACASSSGGSGTVTSVGLAVPAEWSVSGSPVTTSGTITISEATQTANTVYAGPTSGGAAAPGFRALVATDLPAHLILDIGDDGGNDSTALAELSTVNDDYAVLTEPSADEAQIDFADLPPYQQYTVERPPSSCAICDEFTNNTATQTWSCNGAANATQSYRFDSMRITKTMSGSGQDMYACTTAAGTASFTLTSYVHPLLPRNTAACGLGIITAGTQASPTAGYWCALFTSSTTGANETATWNSFSTYTTGNATVANLSLTGSGYALPVWVQIRYDDTANTLGCYSSWDARTWRLIGSSSSITSDPLFFGPLIDDLAAGATTDMECQWDQVRYREDSDGIDTSPFVGE